MPKPVVDVFQIVEIEQQYPKGSVAPVGTPHLALQCVDEFTIIRQTRQGIMRRLIMDLIFMSFALGDINAGADTTYDFAARGAQGAEANLKIPILMPVLISRSEEHTSELQSLRHLVCR